jgi:ATP-dependent Clp protease ATP-binding subunit ClpX
LFEIMVRSEGSVIRQYEREFGAYGIRARFHEDGLRVIAERAAKEKTGARGLVTVCESVLRDFKYYLPGSSVTEFEVSGALVENPGPELARYREEGKAVSHAQVENALSTYRAEFREENAILLDFDDAAKSALRELSAERGVSVLQLCKELFSDYQFGLKLIQKNTGLTAFLLGERAIQNPDKFLSDLVVQSYQDSSGGQDA